MIAPKMLTVVSSVRVPGTVNIRRLTPGSRRRLLVSGELWRPDRKESRHWQGARYRITAGACRSAHSPLIEDQRRDRSGCQDERWLSKNEAEYLTA
jgi:hypothetical protein